MVAIHRQQSHRAAERGIANDHRPGLDRTMNRPIPDSRHAISLAPGTEEELGGGDIGVNSPDPVILIGASDACAGGPGSIADHQVIVSGHK